MKTYIKLNTKRLITTLAGVIFVCNSIWSQTTSVSGEVISAYTKHPIIGATIEVLDSKISTTTDQNGKFTLENTPQKGTIIFRFRDLQPVTKKIKSGKHYKISMKIYIDNEDDELVNIGYGREKKSSVTGAISSLNSEDISQNKAADVGATIKGKVPGVSVSSTSSVPGSTSQIYIRGVNSIYGGNTPLYVVDGITFESDPEISPNEIYSIDVLKDAASTAIYGSRGACGVILITTKGAYQIKQASLEQEKRLREEAKAKKEAQKAAKKAAKSK